MLKVCQAFFYKKTPPKYFGGTKFHFIPILFGAFLFLVAETISDNGNRKDRQRNIVGMIIVIT